MKILSIVVTYNAQRQNWIEKCLSSLGASNIKTDVIIIDNASTDKTVDYIKNIFPQYTLVESKINLGFAKGNNIGIRKAYNENYDYVFLLNQDAWIENNTIEELIRIHSANSEYGILSPIQLNGKGVSIDLNFTSYISQKNDDGRKLLSDLVLKRDLSSVYSVDFVNAASWLISRDCLHTTGCFDDDLFPHYGEDNNYIERVHFHKYKVGVVPNTFVYHDREEREAKPTSSFSENLKYMSFKIQGTYINNNQDFEKLTKELNALKKWLKRERLKFNFKKANVLKQELEEKTVLLEKIKKNRDLYKKTGFNIK
jgi:GT2 family glycosyltransferase